DAATLELEVALVEALGADTVVHGALAGAGASLTARLDGTTRVAVGDRLALLANPKRLHLFDPDSGRRLGNAADLNC
ncbi:MAG: TOBE domain-containing protein, partial [Geminicoccales bacterium]